VKAQRNSSQGGRQQAASLDLSEGVRAVRATWPLTNAVLRDSVAVPSVGLTDHPTTFRVANRWPIMPWGEPTYPWGEPVRLGVFPWGEPAKLLAKYNYSSSSLVG
jgi:hypothetical protein